MKRRARQNDQARPANGRDGGETQGRRFPPGDLPLFLGKFLSLNAPIQVVDTVDG